MTELEIIKITVMGILVLITTIAASKLKSKGRKFH